MRTLCQVEKGVNLVAVSDHELKCMLVMAQMIEVYERSRIVMAFPDQTPDAPAAKAPRKVGRPKKKPAVTAGGKQKTCVVCAASFRPVSCEKVCSQKCREIREAGQKKGWKAEEKARNAAKRKASAAPAPESAKTQRPAAPMSHEQRLDLLRAADRRVAPQRDTDPLERMNDRARQMRLEEV